MVRIGSVLNLRVQLDICFQFLRDLFGGFSNIYIYTKRNMLRYSFQNTKKKKKSQTGDSRGTSQEEMLGIN